MDAQIVAFKRPEKILPFPRKGLPINIGHLRFIRMPVGTFVGRVKDGSVNAVSFKLGIPRAPFEELMGAISLFRQNPEIKGISLFYNEHYNIFYLAASKSYEQDMLVCKIDKTMPMSQETGLYIQIENLEENSPDITLYAGMEGSFSRLFSLFILFSSGPRDAA